MPIVQYGSLAELREFETFSALLDFFIMKRSRADRMRQRSGDLFKKLRNLQERAVRKAVHREKNCWIVKIRINTEFLEICFQQISTIFGRDFLIMIWKIIMITAI